jgi:hypothetical protein
MFETLQSQITALLALGVCGLAVWKGDRPERLGGLAAAITWVASAAAQDWPRADGPEYGIMAVDLAYLVFSLWLGLSSGRLWALCVAAFQLLIVLTHVATIIDLRIGQFGFFSAYFIWSYLIIVALGVGTLQAMRRRRTS